MDTYVESFTESLTHPQFSEQGFLEDVDYDDTALEEMLHNAHRVHVYHSQREGLSVGQSSSSVSERTGRSVGERAGRPVRPSGQELNVGNAQIRNLLDRQREQILAECQAEIKKHEFQAERKLSEIIESQQEELHCAQAEELQRRGEQLLHEQLLQQNLELREAHNKSLNEMEELKEFQISTFDTSARRRLVEDQDTILELTGKRYRNCKMKLIVWMIQKIFRMLNQFAVEIPTLPVDQCHSHLIQFLEECWAVL